MRKFDPLTALQKHGVTPAKAAKVAKVEDADAAALAGLASLAARPLRSAPPLATRPACENSTLDAQENVAQAIDLDLISDAISASPRSPIENDFAYARVARAAVATTRALKGVTEGDRERAADLCASTSRQAANAIRARDYLGAFELLDRLAAHLAAMGRTPKETQDGNRPETLDRDSDATAEKEGKMQHVDWTPEQVLAALETAGVSLKRDGDRLIANPRSKVLPSLAAAITAHKAALMELLAEQPSTSKEEEAAPADDHAGDEPGSTPASPVATLESERIQVIGEASARDTMPMWVASYLRMARRRGMHVALSPDGSLFLSAPLDAWEKTAQLRQWIREHAPDVAVALAAGCRWCGRSDAQLDSDGLCNEKCRSLAKWAGWELTEANTKSEREGESSE